MSRKYSATFAALIGWVDRPATNGHLWRGVPRLLSGGPVPMRSVHHAGGRAIGEIERLTVDDYGAVHAIGSTWRYAAGALQDRTSVLLADLHQASPLHMVGDRVVLTNPLLAGALLGPPHLFIWEERP